MIRNDKEYQAAVKRVREEKKRILAQKAQLQAMGLKTVEIKRAIDPIMSFHLQLAEEIANYEKLRRGEFEELSNFDGIGRLLIALRIYAGLSQRQLAQRLGVHEAQVSRDERNEYHNITIDRAGKILEVLGFSLRSIVSRNKGKAA